jgi:protein-serine/threonine kinase
VTILTRDLRSNSTRREEITPDQLIIEASACWSTADVPALEADIFMSPASKKHIAANPQTMQRIASNFSDTKYDRENPKPREETPQNGSASTHTSDQARAKNNNRGEFYTTTEALARPSTSGRFVSPISSSHEYGSATTTTLGAPKNHAKPVDILPATRAGESSTSESTSSSNEKHTAKHLPPSQISEASSHTFVSSRVGSRPSPISKRIQSMAIHTDNLSRSDRDEEHEACRTKERKIDQYETLCTADEDEERRRRPGWTLAGTPTTTVASKESFKSVPSIGALDGGHVFEAKMEPTNLPTISFQRNPHRAKLSQMTSQGRAAEVSSPSRSVTQESSFQEASHQAEKNSSEHDSSRSIKEELLGPVESDYILGGIIRVHGLRKDVWAQKKDGGERVTITLKTKLTRGSYSDLLYEINREVKILRKLHHPNLAHFYKMEESGTDFGIFFKNLPGGSLWDYIQERKSLQENEACEFFAHLISGVGYLQKVGVIHYLTRPKNLLLDEHCRLVIHNFILARTFYPNNLLPKKGNDNLANGTMPEALVQESGYQFLQELMLERNGDSTYIAPEILGDSLYPAAKVDIWSCGLVLVRFIQ